MSQNWILYWVSLVAYCRYNRLDCLYLNAGIMPNPQFDVKAFFTGLFSRYIDYSKLLSCTRIYFKHLSRCSRRAQISVTSSLQSHHHNVCNRWGDSYTEGQCHCRRPARGFHDQPLWPLPACEWLHFWLLDCFKVLSKLGTKPCFPQFSAETATNQLLTLDPIYRADTQAVCHLATMLIKN